MKFKFAKISILVLPLICGIATAGDIQLSGSEKLYLSNLEKLTQQLNAKGENATNDDDRKAHAILENLLIDAIGPRKIPGFGDKAKLIVGTLFRGDLGYGRADLLVYSGNREKLYITTANLLQEYLNRSTHLPKDLRAASLSRNFYTSALSSEATATLFATVPVKITGKAIYAIASLGMFGQDFGPYVPGTLFVYVSDGKTVYIVEALENVGVNMIPKCQRQWDSASRPIGDMDAENKAYSAYTKCFGREIVNTPIYVRLSKQAQSIVDRVSKHEPMR